MSDRLKEAPKYKSVSDIIANRDQAEARKYLEEMVGCLMSGEKLTSDPADRRQHFEAKGSALVELAMIANFAFHMSSLNPHPFDDVKQCIDFCEGKDFHLNLVGNALHVAVCPDCRKIVQLVEQEMKSREERGEKVTRDVVDEMREKFKEELMKPWR